MPIPTPNPMIILHGILSCFPEGKNMITRDESVAIFVPIYNERDEIYPTLSAILMQTRLPNMIVASENGSTDGTRDVIRKFISDNGGLFVSCHDFKGEIVEEYVLGKIRFVMILHKNKTGKAASVNFAKGILLSVDRVISIDSDTIMFTQVVESMMGRFYSLARRKGKYEIHERAIVAGLVRSRRDSNAGIISCITHRARCANHDIGQYVARLGQNKTAGFVVSGCGYAVASKDFDVPERTITEDLDFTWKMELRKEERTVISLERVRGLGFLINGVPFADTMSEEGIEEITFVKSWRVYYERKAIFFPVTPGTIRGLRRQVDRWSYGLQQNLILYNKDLFANKRLAFVVLTQEFLAIWGAICVFAIPAAVLSWYIFGYGVPILFGLMCLGVSFSVCGTLIFLGAQRRRKILGDGKTKRIFGSLFDAVDTVIPAYLYRWIMAPTVLRNVVRAIIDVMRNNTSGWTSSWARPHEVNNE